MYIYLLEIKFTIDDAFSLKDRRKITRSILDYARKNLNISAADLSADEISNLAHLAFVSLSNDNEIAKIILEKLFRKVDSSYPINICQYEISRIY